MFRHCCHRCSCLHIFQRLTKQVRQSAKQDEASDSYIAACRDCCVCQSASMRRSSRSSHFIRDGWQQVSVSCPCSALCILISTRSLTGFLHGHLSLLLARCPRKRQLHATCSSHVSLSWQADMTTNISKREFHRSCSSLQLAVQGQP